MAYRSTASACTGAFPLVLGLLGQSIAQAGPGKSSYDFNDSHFQLTSPLFATWTLDASEELRKGNDERLFDAAHRNVRVWERANVK